MTEMFDDLDFSRINSHDPKIKFGFIKELLQIAKAHPEIIYTHLDHITPWLQHNNSILLWSAIDLIGYVSAVDNDKKINELITILFHHLHGGHLITCNHVIFALGKIYMHQPECRKKILKEWLKVPQDTFETEECRNIAIGKIMEVLGNIPEDIRRDKQALSLIKETTTSTRNVTRKKAIHLLNQLIT